MTKRRMTSASVEAWKAETALKPRLKIMQERHEKLQDACTAYEEATEEDPTPAQEARLDRMIGLSNRANWHADNLEERISILNKIQCLIDDEQALADPLPSDRYKGIIRNRLKTSR